MPNKIVHGWEVTVWLDKTSLATLANIGDDIAELLSIKYADQVGDSYISVGPAEFDEDELIGTLDDEQN